MIQLARTLNGHEMRGKHNTLVHVLSAYIETAQKRCFPEFKVGMLNKIQKTGF